MPDAVSAAPPPSRAPRTGSWRRPRGKETPAAAPRRKRPATRAHRPGGDGAAATSRTEVSLPAAQDWRTSDAQEIAKRRLRAREETFRITNLDPRFPVFSDFQVDSPSGLTYRVEIRDPARRQAACECVDFRGNGLGTCKHVEAVCLFLEARLRPGRARRRPAPTPPAESSPPPHPAPLPGAAHDAAAADAAVGDASGTTASAPPESGAAAGGPLGTPGFPWPASDRIDLVRDPERPDDAVRLERGRPALTPAWRRQFDRDGRPRPPLADEPPEVVVARWQAAAARQPAMRLSQEVAAWLEQRRRAAERTRLRRDYEQKVRAGEWPPQETLVPLYPYQREGMLHLAFTERALLADEMGLGKTIQAIAACALLHRLGLVERVLVVAPASLKAEWEEQIGQFTRLPCQLVNGPRARRAAAYERARAPFFTLVNYEQIVADALDVNARLRPDVVVLDEAQRIKNWNTQTAQAVKRLVSRYAFVLTGTPLENRIDELRSLVDFLDPTVLGPLFRFNREYYQLDDRGRPVGLRNLDQLQARVRPYLLRRRKAEVETQLPERTDRTFFVPLSEEQRLRYRDHEENVRQLAARAARRPLTREQQERLLRELAMMRMVCDTNYILDQRQRACPKLRELRSLLAEAVGNPGVKVLVFSEWTRMLALAAKLCAELRIPHAVHTGELTQTRRRAELRRFKSDPDCRVLLSSDSGSTGLNLQVASVVVNCDLPWNPARLEQRIARAWRKHQPRPVTVINLVAEGTIEHRMLGTLAFKQALAEGVLDGRGDLGTLRFANARESFLRRLQQLLTAPPAAAGAGVGAVTEAVGAAHAGGAAPPGAVPDAPPSVPESPSPGAPPSPPAAPADRARAFGQRVRGELNGALVRCEERAAGVGPPVLFVVVETDAPGWQEKLAPLHAEWFPAEPARARAAAAGAGAPAGPTRLRVIDRQTDDALRQLAADGLVVVPGEGAGGVRPLWPWPGEGDATPGGDGGPPPLTAAEQARWAECRQLAGRKLRAARLLGEAELVEEARAALGEAVVPVAAALAVPRRWPEPATAADALRPPYDQGWATAAAAAALRGFLAAPEAAPWQPALQALEDALAAATAAAATRQGESPHR